MPSWAAFAARLVASTALAPRRKGATSMSCPAGSLALARLRAEGLHVATIDTGDAAALAEALRGQDAVLNALPYHLAIGVAQLALQVGCHYFDLTEDVVHRSR